MSILRYDDFHCFGLAFSVFVFFGAEERKHAIVCITPYRVERGIDKYDWEVL